MPEDDPLRAARQDLLRAVDEMQTAADPLEPDDELGRLLAVSRQINAELDIESVLNLAVQQVIRLFEAESVFIVELGEADQLHFRAAVTFQGNAISRPENEVSHALIRQVAEQKQPILVANAQEDERFAQVSSVRNLQLHSVMAAPLLAMGELLGVVYADNRLMSGAFSQRKLDLLGMFASHVGVALRNARLFRELNETREQLALSERLQAIGELAAYMAHKVKNPLGSIRILVDAMRDRWTDAELRNEVFDVVPREVDRLDRTVNDVLAYARPTPLIKVPLDLAGVMNSALKTMVPLIEQEGISLRAHYEEGLPHVLADGERLREVFVNLIKNAVEAMSGQPVRELHIGIRRSGEAEEEVTVADTGPGIPGERLESVFVPFQTGKQGGSGIGLALCRKVIREHGGKVTAENAPRGGACFRILLPVSGT